MQRMKPSSNRLINGLIWLLKTAKYNLKIIFSNRFIWFLLSAFGFYIFISFQFVWNNEAIDEGFMYGSLIFPGILLIFYPTVFGIQNDEDARVLEILFGIPNYRYKVWLIRLVMIFILVYVILVLFAILGSIALIPVNVFEMTGQLMFPLFFIGFMAFMFSTLIKNGNGTAVVMVIMGVVLLILEDAIDKSMWNVFLNPYKPPWDMNEVIWKSITFKNRIFLTAGSIVFMLFGLFNLQKRERYI